MSKLERQVLSSLSRPPEIATPTEHVDARKLDKPGPRPSPTEPTPPGFAPPETLFNTTPKLPGTPGEVKEDVPTTPKPWPTSSLTPTHHSQVPAPAPIPTKTEPGKPHSLWDRKKLKEATPPAPASNLYGGETMNSSGVWGDASGGGENTKSIAMPTIVGDRQSVFTNTTRDQKRESQREGVVEGFLGSNSARRRNDSAQLGMAVKPAPAPAPQKSGGWGSWGSSLLNNIANVVERTPSPELPPARPKIEDPPRGFTPSQPPKIQPAGFGSLNKPAWGHGPGPSPGDNNAWDATKTGPTPAVQKPSAGPAWGAKPADATFGPGGTGWGSGTGSTFGSGMGKNLQVDTAMKPLESSPSIAGPENIPELAIEIKHVPAPGGFNSSGSWNSTLPSPVQGKVLETQLEETEGPAKIEEVATPAEEEEFDWANQGKKKKGSRGPSVAQIPFAPNTPDPDNADDGPTGGGGVIKKKKKGRR